VDTVDAAWLLWKHNFVTRRLEGAPRGLSPEGNVNRWELLNAVESRKECLAALQGEHKKAYDGLVSIYPNEPVSQSTLADGISSSISTGAEKAADLRLSPRSFTMNILFGVFQSASIRSQLKQSRTRNSRVARS
jgi:hypothetical protein